MNMVNWQCLKEAFERDGLTTCDDCELKREEKCVFLHHDLKERQGVINQEDILIYKIADALSGLVPKEEVYSELVAFYHADTIERFNAEASGMFMPKEVFEDMPMHAIAFHPEIALTEEVLLHETAHYLTWRTIGKKGYDPTRAHGEHFHKHFNDILNNN